MAEHTVTIGGVLTPAQIDIDADDAIVWINTSPQVQTVSSDDGGTTFTTGPIQVNSRSLPIVFPVGGASVPYTCTSGLHGAVTVRAQAQPQGGGVSFAADVKPFFSALDRDSMRDAQHTFGVITFDLWSRDDCEANWDAINDAIAAGRMPPPDDTGNGPWPATKIDQFVATLKQWKDAGFPA